MLRVAPEDEKVRCRLWSRLEPDKLSWRVDFIDQLCSSPEEWSASKVLRTFSCSGCPRRSFWPVSWAQIQQFAVLQNLALTRTTSWPSTHHAKTQAEQEMWAGWDPSDNNIRNWGQFRGIVHQKRQLFECKLMNMVLGKEGRTCGWWHPQYTWTSMDESEQDDLLSEVLQELGKW